MLHRSAFAFALAFDLIFVSALNAQQRSSEQVTTTQVSETQAVLSKLSDQAKEFKWTFTPRMTGVSARAIESLAGENTPSARQLANAAAVNMQAERIVALYNGELGPIARAAPACDPSATAFDWRSKGKVTRPKLQQCGDCWAFAATGQIESAFLMAGWPESDLSEQQVLDCSNSGSCGGGRRWDALPWAAGTGVATETQYKYRGVQRQCNLGVNGSSKLLASGWVDSSGDVPDPSVLRKALCDHGPISVSIYASAALQNYGGRSSDVFNENNNNNGTNHAVLIVGWDNNKQAWLMKNSWGSDWGFDGGYGWIEFGSNNIGRWAVWAKAPAPERGPSPDIAREIARLRFLAAGGAGL